MSDSDKGGYKAASGSDPAGRAARQTRPGRARQLRKTMMRRTLTASEAARAAQQSQEGAAQQQLARTRQVRTAKQIGGARSVTDIAAIPKMQLARSVQLRQFAANRSLRAFVPEDLVVTIPKTVVARVAQVSQRATTRASRRQAKQSSE